MISSFSFNSRNLNLRITDKTPDSDNKIGNLIIAIDTFYEHSHYESVHFSVPLYICSFERFVEMHIISPPVVIIEHDVISVKYDVKFLNTYFEIKLLQKNHNYVFYPQLQSLHDQ